MADAEPLVVGVDGSAASVRALRWALAEGRRRERLVRVVMVWESRAVLAGPAPLLMYPELAPHHVREEHRRSLIQAVRTCMEGASTPEVEAKLIEGRAAEVLVGESAGAAMLVVGDRGRGRAAEAVVGSTASRCVHKARCPVLIIPRGVAADEVKEEQEFVPNRDSVLE